jgi:DNA-binding NtrC family response regulator
MAKTRVLVVDDEEAIRFALRDFLEIEGFEVAEAVSVATALAAYQDGHPDVVLLDYRLPDGTALELLPRLRAHDPAVPVIVLTAHASIDLAVRAIKEGAEQFLTKPLELPALHLVLQRVLENQRNRQRQQARRTSDARRTINPFVGASPHLRELEVTARKVAASESPVLITGETGTGKGVLARWLHVFGPRSDDAFVDLNCAGLSAELLDSELFGHERGAFTTAVRAKEGLLEVANGGTLFLDEIGDMDVQVQAKLLKVLEEQRFRRVGDVRDRAVNVRLIAATHQDLPEAVKAGRFRRDLYYRINTIQLNVPPLRERGEDILRLADDLLARLGADLGRASRRLGDAAREALLAYPWPGNVRELRNVLERAVLLSDNDVLDPRDLRFESAGAAARGPSLDLTLRDLEVEHIKRVLEAERGRIPAAAERLGVPKSSLYQKLKTYGIDAGTFRR